MDLQPNPEDSERLRQLKQSFNKGYRTVDCPECNAKQSVKTEVDNKYGICNSCGKKVEVGRLI